MRRNNAHWAGVGRSGLILHYGTCSGPRRLTRATSIKKAISKSHHDMTKAYRSKSASGPSGTQWCVWVEMTHFVCRAARRFRNAEAASTFFNESFRAIPFQSALFTCLARQFHTALSVYAQLLFVRSSQCRACRALSVSRCI